MEKRRRQQLKSGLEVDVILARKHYCFTINNPSIVKWVKRRLNKRWRKELKKEMEEEYDSSRVD